LFLVKLAPILRVGGNAVGTPAQRRWTKSASTARSSSPPFLVPLRRQLCGWKCNGAHSGRFAIVKPVDPADPAVADVVADWKERLGAVGVHIILMKEEEAKREWNLRRELLLVNERAIFRAFSVPRTIKATALRAAGWLKSTAAYGPTLPTWALQQVGGFQGYTGRAANVVAKAALAE